MYKAIDPIVTAFTQLSSRLFFSAKAAHASRKPLVVVSVTGAALRTEAIPPTSVIGRIDTKETVSSFV